MIKIEEQNLTEIQKIVRQKGFNLNLQNKSGQCALSQAVRKGNNKILEMLLNNGADINIQNQAGQTPLFIACWYNKLEVAKFLLKKGANVNCQDHRKWAPLTIAAYQGNAQLLEILAKYNPNYLFRDISGKSVIERGKDQKIKQLISAKMNQYNSKLSNSESPLKALQTAKFPFQAAQYLSIHETPLIKKTNKKRNTCSKSPFNDETSNISNSVLQDTQNEISLSIQQQLNYLSPVNESSKMNYYLKPKPSNQMAKQQCSSQEFSEECNREESRQQLQIEPSQLDTLNEFQSVNLCMKTDDNDKNDERQQQYKQFANNFSEIIKPFFDKINAAQSSILNEIIEKEEFCKQFINLIQKQQRNFLSKFVVFMNNEFFPKIMENLQEFQEIKNFSMVNRFQEELITKLKTIPTTVDFKFKQSNENFAQQKINIQNLEINDLTSVLLNKITLKQDQQLNQNILQLQDLLNQQKDKLCHSMKYQVQTKVSSELEIITENMNAFIQNQNDIQLPNMFNSLTKSLTTNPKAQNINIIANENQSKKIETVAPRSKTPQVYNLRPMLNINQGTLSPNSQLINLDSFKKSPLRLSRDYQSYTKSRQNKTSIHFEFNENHDISEIKTPEIKKPEIKTPQKQTMDNHQDCNQNKNKETLTEMKTPRQDSSSKLQQLRQSIQKKLSNIEMNYVNTYQNNCM